MARTITTISDFMQPILQNQMAQQQVGAQPLKDLHMMASTYKALHPTPPVFEQKLQGLKQLALSQGMTEDQANKMVGLARLSDLTGQNKNQMSVNFPGGSVQTGGGGDLTPYAELINRLGGTVPKPVQPFTRGEMTSRQKAQRAMMTTLPLLQQLKEGGRFTSAPTRYMAEAGGKLKEYAPWVADAFGVTGSEKDAMVQFEANIEKATEGVVNSLGLTPTVQTLADFKKVMKPQSGETQKGYESRIEREIAELVERYNKLQSTTAQGMPETLQPAQKPVMHEGGQYVKRNGEWYKVNG